MSDRLPSKSHLERLVAAHAESTQIAHARIRRWVSTMVLIAALDRVRAIDNTHQFVIKGGLAMELRLGTSARATADVDATFYGDPEQIERALEEALAEPVSGFTFRATARHQVGTGKAVRIAIRLNYRGKPWSTVDTEISAAEPPADIELIPAVDLEHFGLAGPTHVAVLSTRYQLAQKLHAVSERFPAGPNRRVRDVLDILLLRDLLPTLEQVRVACVNVFGERATHSWPPTVTIYDEWPVDYEVLRDHIGFHVANVTDAVSELHEFIRAIDAAVTS